MHQFGGSMFAFEIVVNQGGKSCFSMCVTQQTPAQESALIRLTASTHKDLCESMCTQTHSCAQQSLREQTEP